MAELTPKSLGGGSPILDGELPSGFAFTEAVLAATEAADAINFDGDVAWWILAQLSATEAADTAALAGNIAVSAWLEATEGPDAADIHMLLPVEGEFALTETADTSSMRAAIGIVADLAVSENPDTAYFRWGHINREFGSDILYRAATPLERAMADTEAEQQFNIDVESIIDVWDPFAISDENLPFLAWGMGVNFWIDGWSEATKRAWTARQWEFKSKVGTLAGPKMAVGFAGRDVSPFGYRILDAIAPPQKVFSGATLSAAQKEAWLDTLPQLRVWKFIESGIAPLDKAFLGSTSTDKQSDASFCLGGNHDADCAAFITPSEAFEHMSYRAKWLVNDVEQAGVTCKSIGSYWQLYLQSTSPCGVFSGLPISDDQFYMPSTAAERIITIAPNPAAPWRSIVGPSLEPISSAPVLVAQSGDVGCSVFSDQPIYDTYFVPSTAPMRLYERYAINDGSLGPRAPGPPVQIMGVGYYGWPKYTAWLRASVANKRPDSAAGEGITALKHFWIPHDEKPLDRVCEATETSMRLADRVLLDIGPDLRFTASGIPFLADIDELIVGEP